MVMKIIPTIVFLSVSLSLWSQPLQTKISHRVIIDTDCAIDDMRTISYLLSRPEITIAAVLVSDGSVAPSEGEKKVRALLREFGADSIPVARGPVLKGVSPPWREFNNKVAWARESAEPASATDAAAFLKNALSGKEEKPVLLCLGPLTNIALAFRQQPDLARKAERIIWYNETVQPPRGFNYTCDPAGADEVLRASIRIDVISNLSKDNAFFDQSLADIAHVSPGKLAEALDFVMSQEPVRERLRQNHFRLSDDLAGIYLTNPELFSINTIPGRMNIRVTADYDPAAVREAISDMIRGTYSTGTNIVFSSFPVRKELFRYDIRPIVDTAIALYGMDEWKANVMTDEFHGHLGVFSIVGAKMGIRAREYFGVGPDMLTAVSFAGSKPPYSCLNDGIQVSTGATLGMGTIRLSGDSLTAPSAIFSYKGRSVRITLKKEYLNMVDADINEGIVKFGLMDDGYWKLIRRNALKYWLGWDRNKIFDLVEPDK